MMGGQQDGDDIGAAGQRDHRVVDEAQQNEARAAEMDQPSQGALFRNEQDDRKQVHVLPIRAGFRLLDCHLERIMCL